MNQLKNRLSIDAVKEISAERKEPSWLTQKRLEAFSAFEKLPMPDSRYTKIRGLELEKTLPFATPSSKPDFAQLPTGLSNSLTNGADGVLFSQLDSQIFKINLPSSLKQQGVIFTDLKTAIKEHSDLVKKYLFNAVSPSEDKMTALCSAFISSGLFIYVPKDVIVKEPLQSLLLMSTPNAGAFTHTILIAEPGSRVTYLEEGYSLTNEPALHAGIAEVYVGEGAQVQYGGIQNWNSSTYNFVRRRAHVARDARMNWTIGWLGGKLTMSHVESQLKGPGAEMEDIQVLFGNGKQHFDLTSALRNMAPNVRGEIHLKAVMKDNSRSVVYGFIKVDQAAQRSNSYQLAQGLLLNDGAHCDAIPGLEIEANDVRATHGASIGPIDEEQIFYLQSRGLPAEKAKRTIVEGFFDPTIEKIPVELVRERFQSLVQHKWD
ncbi:Fe-S cluster assembly protein SufD [Candidatus Acetothermia bacterium]|nr:Fe-S cluster assembly protein SufD [Candidatus Acetothermia bacterium]